MSDKYVNANGVSAIKNYIDTKIGTKQDALVSGTNIKTINNTSILGSGNITIEGGGMELVSNPTVNNVLLTDATGQAIDSGVNLDSKVDTTYSTTNDTSQVANVGNAISLRQYDNSDPSKFGQLLLSKSQGLLTTQTSRKNGGGNIYTRLGTLPSDTEGIYLEAGIWNSSSSDTTNILRVTPTSTTITNVVTPTNNTDAANKQYVDDTVSTAVNTQATETTLGTIKLNPSESITLNSSGQLDVGGRLGQMSNTTGIYSPKTINPAAVGNGSFLLTEGSGLKLGNKSLAVVTGTSLSLKSSASAGTTTYLVSNTYENRIICAGIVDGVLALNESTAAEKYVNVTSVTIGGYAPTTANYWTASGDITIKTDASINPNSRITSVRPYATGEAGFSNLFVGQLSGGKGGASIVVGQKVFSYSGNACAIVGASMYNTGNGNALFGRQHISRKNRSFLAGTGHDTTNGPSEGVAAIGKWSNIKSNTSFAIGNGTDANNRSNSFEIDTSGDATFGGYVKVEDYLSAASLTATGTITAGGDITDGAGTTIAQLLAGSKDWRYVQSASRSSSLSDGACRGIYSASQGLVILTFYAIASSALSTSETLFTLPSEIKPTETKHGVMIHGTAANTYTSGGTCVVTANGELKQSASNSFRIGSGIIMYSLFTTET